MRCRPAVKVARVLAAITALSCHDQPPPTKARVATPVAVTPSNGRSFPFDTATRAGAPRYLYDTLVRVGFGPFAKRPRTIGSCVSARATNDSVVFGKIGHSAADGDAYGVEMTFEVAGDSIRGQVRFGEGGISGPMALQGLRSNSTQ